jgi:hypothetical protein
LAWTLAGDAALWLALDNDPAELALARSEAPANSAAPVRLAVGDGCALALPAGCSDLAFFAWSLC